MGWTNPRQTFPILRGDQARYSHVMLKHAFFTIFDGLKYHFYNCDEKFSSN